MVALVFVAFPFVGADVRLAAPCEQVSGGGGAIGGSPGGQGREGGNGGGPGVVEAFEPSACCSHLSDRRPDVVVVLLVWFPFEASVASLLLVPFMVCGNSGGSGGGAGGSAGGGSVARPRVPEAGGAHQTDSANTFLFETDEDWRRL